jgi:hypothetical protein
MTMRLFLPLALLALGAGLAAAPRPAAAAPSHDGCTGFIDTVGTTVTTPGTWCLRQDLTTTGDDGTHAISVATSDVVIDCNGHSIRYTGGIGTTRTGIRAQNLEVPTAPYVRVAVRRCVISGFRLGIALFAPEGVDAGYLVEDNVIEDGGYVGIRVDGNGSVIRRNHVSRLSPIAGITSVTGIYAFYGVDIRDNTVEDVAAGSAASATGILGVLGPGQAIQGNRIRRLSSGTGINGIRVDTSTGAKVSGNDLAGDGHGIGVRCYGEFLEEVRVGDNIFNGFSQALDSDGYCGDLGTNDFTP